jgi:NitT/TauT family transport system substrate-binding protein
MEILTLPGSQVASPQDLAGKRIGTPEPQEMSPSDSKPYSLETTAAWAALANQNVSPSGIHWVAMPTPRLAIALRTHQVDAILVTEPTISETESQLGLVPVLDACSGPTANLPLDGYFTTRAYAKEHAAALAAFRSALAKAQATAGISAPVQTALETYAKMDKRTAALVTVGTYPTSLLPQNIQRVASLMFFYNALTSPASATQLAAP